jgi:hypothetical protein
MNKELNKITGHANPGSLQQFKQIATAAVSGTYFHGFIPVGGDAVLSVLTNKGGASALGYLDSTTVYQNVFYPGDFEAITLTSGKAVLYLGEQ